MIPGRTPACREASTIRYRVRTYIKACNYRTRPPPILPSFNPSRWLVWPCTLYIGCLGYERSTESCTHYSSHRLYPQQKSAALSRIWRISTPTYCLPTKSIFTSFEKFRQDKGLADLTEESSESGEQTSRSISSTGTIPFPVIHRLRVSPTKISN